MSLVRVTTFILDNEEHNKHILATVNFEIQSFGEGVSTKWGENTHWRESQIQKQRYPSGVCPPCTQQVSFFQLQK